MARSSEWRRPSRHRPRSSNPSPALIPKRDARDAPITSPKRRATLPKLLSDAPQLGPRASLQRSQSARRLERKGEMRSKRAGGSAFRISAATRLVDVWTRARNAKFHSTRAATLIYEHRHVRFSHFPFTHTAHSLSTRHSIASATRAAMHLGVKIRRLVVLVRNRTL